MPLPQQVVEQLSRGSSPSTPGWSSGIILFSGSVLGILLLIYVGLVFGYEPYLNSQISQMQIAMTTLSQQVSSSDQTKVIDYYSEITNLQSLVQKHVVFSQFLTWLGNNTEANIYYGDFTFASGNQVVLSAYGASQADVNQQIAIFESSSDVSSVSISSVTPVASTNMWSFQVTLTMNPSVFQFQSGTGSRSTPTQSVSVVNSVASSSLPPSSSTISVSTTTAP